MILKGKKFVVLGVHHTLEKEFATPIELVMDYVKPGMRIGLELPPTNLRIHKKLIEAEKKFGKGKVPLNERKKIFGKTKSVLLDEYYIGLMKEILSAGAIPVALDRKKLLAKAYAAKRASDEQFKKAAAACPEERQEKQALHMMVRAPSPRRISINRKLASAYFELAKSASKPELRKFYKHLGKSYELLAKTGRLYHIRSIKMLQSALRKRVDAAVMGAEHALDLEQTTLPESLKIKYLVP